MVALSGCSLSFDFPSKSWRDSPPPAAPQPVAPIVETPEGERPAICYVRARSFNGLVPLSCGEALLARP